MGQTGAWWGGAVGRRGGGVVHVAAVRGGWDGGHVLVEVWRGFRLGDWSFFAGSCGSWGLGLMGGSVGVGDGRGRGGDGWFDKYCGWVIFLGTTRRWVLEINDIGRQHVRTTTSTGFSPFIDQNAIGTIQDGTQ